jgi:hypothetical protein
MTDHIDTAWSKRVHSNANAQLMTPFHPWRGNRRRWKNISKGDIDMHALIQTMSKKKRTGSRGHTVKRESFKEVIED